MAEQGFTVLRFTNAEVHGNVEGVVTEIRLEVERLLNQSFAAESKTSGLRISLSRGL